MLMLMRTYRLVRFIDSNVRRVHINLKMPIDEPDQFSSPSIEDVIERFRIYSLREGKRNYILKRTLKFAEANGYIMIDVKGSGSAYKYLKVDPVNGERLLQGKFYLAWVKELIRVNNFLATLLLATIAIIISLFALFKPN